ncbi:DUF5919 domain-containing protein [Actinocorallia longicatena]
MSDGWMRSAARRVLRHRRRQLVTVVVLGLSSVAMLVGAHEAGGYWRDLMLNIGASLVLVVASYAIFDSVFEELRAGRVVEHDSLDRNLCLRRFGEAHSTLAIMETWTGLLEDPFAARFLDILREALVRGVEVRILLLSPGSIAAEERTRELGGERRGPGAVDVAREIESNLLQLHRFARERLPEQFRDRFEVRVTPNMPSVQLYRWDQKALISFFPLNERAYDSSQLEVFLNTPVGRFVEEDFETKWEAADTADLAAYMRLELTVAIPGEDPEEVSCEFVTINGDHYISVAGLGYFLDRFDDVRLSPPAGERLWRLSVVARDHFEEVELKFTRKYGTGRDTFLRLIQD